MRISICAPFMQSDLWQERFRKAAPDVTLEFDEYYDADGIRRAPAFRYAVCIVAMSGDSGRDAATAIRERDREVPLIWISDDDHQGLMAYKLCAKMFLSLDCSQAELENAMYRCGVRGEPKRA